MSATKPIPFEGVLNCWNDAHDFPDLLLAVCRSQKTGRLRFSNPEADKILHVKDGRVVFAESSSDDDGLGQYLLRIGKISLEHYARVSKLVEPGKRLGALLVAEGVLEPKDLVPAVVGQVRAIILGLFRRTESWYQFKEEELPRKESITLDMPVAALVLDGVQQVDSWRRVSKGAGDIESVHRLVDSAKAEWSELPLDPDASELLSFLEEPMTIARACARSRLSDFEACRYAWAFRSLGWIETTEAASVVAPSPAAGVASNQPPPPAVEEPAATTLVSTGADDVGEELSEPAAGAGSEAEDAQGDVDHDSLAIAAAAAADRATSVGDSPAAKPSIPESLIQTRVSVKPPEAPKTTPPRPPAPRPVPDDLVRTQMIVSPPTAPPPGTPRPAPTPVPDDLVRTQMIVSPPTAPLPGTPRPAPQSTTLPDASKDPKPRPVPNDLVHTQLDVRPPSKSDTDGATLSTPSAAEMMESILNDGDTPPSLSPSPSHAASAAPAGSNASTHFFSGPTAFESDASVETPETAPDDDAFSLPEESYDDFLGAELASGFDSLALDAAPPASAPEASVTRPEVREPFAEEAQLTMASFQDLSLSEPVAEAPTAEAPEPPAVDEPAVSVPEGDSALPVLEGEIVTAESLPPQPSGMEFLIGDDPFASPAAEAAPSASFSTEDLLTRREEPVAAAIPKRPRTEEMDFDMDGFGHVLGRDE